MNIQTAIGEFLLASGADGLRRKTLKWYGSLLGKFGTRFGGRDIVSVTPTEIRAYLVHLRELAYSEDTLHGHTRALHRFWRWCANEYEIPNPMRNIAYPQQPKPKLPKGVDSADVVKLLLACEQSPIGRRNKAIIAFLTETGCRAAGLTGLKMEDLDMDRLRAYVTEKGGKRRAVMFTEFTAVLLNQWLVARNPKPRVSNVFHNEHGGVFTPGGLYLMTRRLKKVAGVKGRANPHAFRHGFAIQYMLDGGDLATLSKILGHESVEVTARFYAIFVQDQLAQAHREHTPIRKIKQMLKNGVSRE